jgi:membrane protein
MRSEKPDKPKWQIVWQLASMVVRGIQKDNCDVYAAQMAFFFLFALFPFLLFLTTLLSYLPVANLLQVLMGILGRFVPADVLSLMEENLRTLVSEHESGLLSIGAFLALWTASSGVTAVITALNNAFETTETRSFWKVRAIAVLLVICLSIFIIVSLLLLMFGPLIGDWIASLAGLGVAFTLAWSLLRWPTILFLMVTAMSAFYRFAPDVRLTWRETVPGSAVATGMWVAVSLAFSYYVNHFGSYDRTYGSIGAVIVLLTWMYVSAFIILLGGEINARMKEEEKNMPAGSETRG